ncbi:MAG: SH3 domain-containing protein [Clostridium sp.]|nr:SH3 domain-containing protein [Clostridium sp.]
MEEIKLNNTPEEKKKGGRGARLTPMGKAVCVAAAVLVLAALGAGMRNCGQKEGGPADGKPGKAETAVQETTLSPEEILAQEKQAVVDSYENLAMANVEGYVNIREQPNKESDIIGKLQEDAACSIEDDSTEGWCLISSGGITGYVNSAFLLTGDEARQKALDLVQERAVVTADAVNIRKEPTTEAEVVAQALNNERYIIEEPENNGWIKLRSGYVAAEYVEVRQSLNEARKLDMRTMVLNLYKNLGISSVATYLNVRESPSEDGKIIGKMTSKCAGEILETSEDGEWYKIQSGPVTGYVKRDYILTGDAANSLALEEARLMAIVSTDMLNVRTEPSTDAKIWTQISNAERYDVVSQQDGWVGIHLDEEEVAYVNSEYVDVRYALSEAIRFSPIDEKSILRSDLVNYALQFVGNRYVWGGNDPHTGADCSGFVKYCYEHVAGITLERVSRDQARHGTAIDSEKMRPGDLVFYTNGGGTVNHVAMYIGNGQIVHAASRRSGIKISTWNYRKPYRIVNYIGD